MKPKVRNDLKFHGFKPKAMKWDKSFITNLKEPIKIWVPKSEILFVSDMLYNMIRALVMVPEPWLLLTHNRRKAYVPKSNFERWRKCGNWRKLDREDNWYGY